MKKLLLYLIILGLTYNSSASEFKKATYGMDYFLNKDTLKKGLKIQLICKLLDNCKKELLGLTTEQILAILNKIISSTEVNSIITLLSNNTNNTNLSTIKEILLEKFTLDEIITNQSSIEDIHTYNSYPFIVLFADKLQPLIKLAALNIKSKKQAAFSSFSS